MKRKIFIDIVASMFILLFTYTAVSKLLDFETFYVQLTQSEIVTRLAVVVAAGVPALEVIIAILLLVEKTRLIGLYLSLSLMSVFTVYVIAITRFSFHTPCSCGGVLELLSWDSHLILNVFLLVAAGIAIWWYPFPDSGSENITMRDLL